MFRKKGVASKSLGVIIAIVVLVAVVLFNSIEFIVNYLWFSEVDYLQVFFKEILTKAEMGLPLFLVLTIVLYVYFSLLKTMYNKKMLVLNSKKENKKENRWIFLGSVILSIFLSTTITSNLWYRLLEFTNASKFGVSDPIFNKDMSFYVFQLPFLEQLYSTGLTVLITIALASFVLFIILFILKSRQGAFSGIDIQRLDLKQLSKDFISMASKQLSVIIGIFFLFLAAGLYLKTFSILYSSSGLVYGAGYTDIYINLWIYKIAILVAVASAVMILIAGYMNNIKLAAVGPIVLILIMVGGNFVALGVENFIVSPNELVKEEPYMVNHIEFTQRAYGLDEVEERDFPVTQNITAEDIARNDITINNIPINDYRPTLSMYNSLQGFRRYYAFKNIDVDRYMIDGEYTQVFLGARELDQDKIDDSSKSWINLHLKYTHGFGAAVSPVNRVNEVGQPELIMRDIPPTGSKDIQITEPRIYFGEMTDDYVITNTNTKEFDYPSGDNNVEYIYEGEAGIKLSFMKRLLFALRQGSFRIMLSNDITPESKILINRNVMDRVQKIAPFFDYDNDAYLVIDEGKLYWIIDAFTTSDRYAYSKPIAQRDFNYIRNSVKVVVDAFNGETTFYQVDPEDPIASTYGKIYPGLLVDIDEMPGGIRSHVRYSQAMFDVQSEMYRTYHMENPSVFYNKEDLWQIPNQIYGAGETEILESTYIIMKNPDGNDEEFMLMIPYTPRDKDNMVSWMAGLNDGDNYGKLVVYKFPKQKLIYGPMQVEKRIDQDTAISKELTLLDQQGSNVVRGNLLTIPIDESLLFVEPIYLESSGGERNLPEVKRVIVAYENQIVMENSLQEGLNRIFGLAEEEKPIEEDPVEDDRPIPTGSVEEQIIKANSLFEKAEQAQRDGDWAKYGEYLKELQATLKELEKSIEVPDIEGNLELENQ